MKGYHCSAGEARSGLLQLEAYALHPQRGQVRSLPLWLQSLGGTPRRACCKEADWGRQWARRQPGDKARAKEEAQGWREEGEEALGQSTPLILGSQ